jgi:WD40 repeat protein
MMAVSPDGRFLAAGSREGPVKLWKWGQWDRPSASAAVAGRLHTLAFTPDGETLAAGWEEDRPEGGGIRLYRTADGERAHTLPGHGAIVRALAISPDGKLLASVGTNNRLNVWDLASKSRSSASTTSWARPFPWPSAPTARPWPPAGATALGFISFPPAPAWSTPRPSGGYSTSGASPSPDGKRLAVGDEIGGVYLYDVRTWESVPAILERGHRHAISALAVSPDGRTVLSTSPDGTLRRWDLGRPGEHTIASRLAEAPGAGVAFSPDGQTYLAHSHDLRGGRVDPPTVRETATGKKRFQLPQAACACACSPDGKTLAWLGGDGTVRLADAASGRELRLLGNVGWAWNLAFSPDGTLLAVACEYTQVVKVWNVETGAEVHSWPDGPLWSVTFSPDGKRLVVGAREGPITVWDLAREEKVRTLRGHTGRVNSLHFTPDGKTLVSSGEDGTVRLWDPDRERAREVIALGPAGWGLLCELDTSGKYAIVGGNHRVIFVLRLAGEGK